MRIKTEEGVLVLDFKPSKYTSKAGAAKALYKALCKAAEERGQNPDYEVSIQNPEECQKLGYGKNWRVSWEAGPYQWAVFASLYGVWNRKAGWYTEPYYSFDLCLAS